MTKKETKNLSPKYQVWIDARKKFRLSHAHIQMARELGINLKKFGKLNNHHQESWKEPLPDFIESLYFKRFDKAKPENVRSVEQIVKDKKCSVSISGDYYQIMFDDDYDSPQKTVSFQQTQKTSRLI